MDDGYIIKRHFNQCRACEVLVQKSQASTTFVPQKISFVTFTSKEEIFVKSEMNASDQKERISGKSSLRTSDPVTISTSSKDSIKCPPFMDSAELRHSALVRKPFDRLNFSSFKQRINFQMLMLTYELMLMFFSRL